MQQVYHSNAVTNIHIRRQIKESSLTNIELAEKFDTSVATISKWRNRQELEDKSSRPCNIIYALNELEQGLAISIRKTTWLSLDEVWETLLSVNPNITRSSIYRTFCRNEILSKRQFHYGTPSWKFSCHARRLPACFCKN